MPVSERQFETVGEPSKIRGIILATLARKKYKVKQDSNEKIVAKHSFSANNYPHEVEVNMDFRQAENSKVTLRIDHRISEVYVERLAKEFGKDLPKPEKQATSTLVSPFRAMKDSEYQVAFGNLGLLEGEEVKLQYSCQRSTTSISWNGKPKKEINKGLLVFTNDNMIFMQQEGAWSSNYAQALRIPLESINGLVSGGKLISHIRFNVGVSGASEQYEFVNFLGISGIQQIRDVRAEIENLLKVVREEKKRLAIEAMAKGTVPVMVFCKYCGARNKADQSHCANCKAVLT